MPLPFWFTEQPPVDPGHNTEQSTERIDSHGVKRPASLNDQNTTNSKSNRC